MPGLTPAAFSGQSRLEIALLVKVPGAAQSSTVDVDVFHNAILVDATNFKTGDRVVADVFESDGKTQVTTPQANYPAGTAAFGAKWSPAPMSPVPAQNSEDYAESLYQLLQYRIL